MLNSLWRLGTINIFEDLVDRSEHEAKNGEEYLTQEEKIDYMSIFKIPKYLERVKIDSINILTENSTFSMGQQFYSTQLFLTF